MRVVILAQYLLGDCSGIAGGLGKALARRGASVEFAAGAPISSNFDPLGKTPSLRIRHESVGDIEVTRYPSYRSHDSSPTRRVLTYTSFAATSSLLALRQLSRADVVLVNATPGTVVTAAMMARKLRGVPYVLLVQDVWPDSVFLADFYRSSRALKPFESGLGHFIGRSYGNASRVLGISEGMRDLLISRGSDPEPGYVYNWADEDAIGDQLVGIPSTHGVPLHIMYAGNLGQAQDLGNVLEALSLLPQGAVRLTLVGAGAAEGVLRGKMRDLGLNNVEFHPSVTRAEVFKLMSSAHVHLISLRDTDLFKITIPSKFQFLAAAGAAMLVSAPGEVADMVRERGLGVSAQPGRPHELAAAIDGLRQFSVEQLRQMGARSRALYDREMSEKINGDRFYSALNAAAAEHRLRAVTSN